MIIKIDIMRGDRYVKTIQYKHCEAFKLDLDDVIKFVEEKNPLLVGKQTGQQFFVEYGVIPSEEKKN